MFEGKFTPEEKSALIDELGIPYAGDFDRDVKTRLEHTMQGGSSPFLYPHKPFALISGKRDLKEVNAERASMNEGKPKLWNYGIRGITAPREIQMEILNRLGRSLEAEVREILPYSFSEIEKWIYSPSAEVDQRIRDQLEAIAPKSLIFYLNYGPFNVTAGRVDTPEVRAIGHGWCPDFMIEDAEIISQVKLKFPRQDNTSTWQAVKEGLNLEGSISAFFSKEGYLFIKSQ